MEFDVASYIVRHTLEFMSFLVIYPKHQHHTVPTRVGLAQEFHTSNALSYFYPSIDITTPRPRCWL